MTEFGLTLAGFVPMSLQDVKADLEGAMRGAFGQNVKVAGESVNGQFIGIMSERLADLWELAEKVTASAYLFGSAGAALDDVVALAGKQRNQATPSQVVLELAGDPFTVIPAGQVVRDPVQKIRWVTTEAGDLGAGGSDLVAAESEEDGAIQGLAGTLTEIVTSVTGWATVTNPEDADEGRAVDSDSKLRADTQLSFRAGGGSATEAVRAFVLRVRNVTECLVVANRGLEPDADGRPGKSFETIVRGGDGQEIADAIWFSQPGGIESHGSTTSAVTDSRGDSQTVKWSRPEEVEIWLRVQYRPKVDNKGDPIVDPDDLEASMLEEVLDFAGTYQIGDPVVPWNVEQRIETEGMDRVTVLAGRTSVPDSLDPIVLARGELAEVDSGRVQFQQLT